MKWIQTGILNICRARASKCDINWSKINKLYPPHLTILCLCACVFFYLPSLDIVNRIVYVHVHVNVHVYVYVYLDVDELTPADQHTELTQLYYQQCMSRSQSWTYSTRSLISYYTDQLQYPDHQMQIQLLALLRRYLNKNIHNQSHQIPTKCMKIGFMISLEQNV